MLFIMLLVRLMTDLLDFPLGLFLDGFGSPVRAAFLFVFIYYIPAIYALWYLWKEVKPKLYV